MNKEFQDRAVNFIWKIANILRGPYLESEYGKVILPFTVLRRLDWLLEPTKDAVLKETARFPKHYSEAMRDAKLKRVTGENFFNTSQYTFKLLLADPTAIAENLKAYIHGFSEEARLIFVKYFSFIEQIDRLDSLNLLYKIVSEFTDEKIDLHPDRVSNVDMGGIFEELIRRFSEQSNAKAGEHFTPREVIHLMASLVITEDRINLAQGRPIMRVFDPACGTGGMLTAAEEYLKSLNPDIRVDLFGQEVNNESFAICQSDMMIKGQDPKNIQFGNSFSEDHFAHQHFNYMLCNPPYGVDWAACEKEVRAEHKNKGINGRFGAGLPRISDGQLLFVQHMLAKMPRDGSVGRIAVIMNGSPLFTGGVESGECAIRRWIIENDWLEAIVALPTEMFYNTGIATFIWILTNKKAPHRQGKIQLIDATSFYVKRESLRYKRKELTQDHINEITRILGDFEAGEYSQIFSNEHFGYRRITVERPLRLNFVVEADRVQRLQATNEFKKLAVEAQSKTLRALSTLPTVTIRNREHFLSLFESALAAADLKLPATTIKKLVAALGERDPTADVCTTRKGEIEPDSTLRDGENVPLLEDVEAYFVREVLPHAPDAWIDHEKTEIGYEILFGREFFRHAPRRSLDAIDCELQQATEEIMEMLAASQSISRKLKTDVPRHDPDNPWIGDIPLHWDVTRLKFVADVRTGVAKGRDLAGQPTITVPYVRVANVQDGYLDLKDVADIEISPVELDRYRLEPGDVLMNEGGDNDKLGRGHIWRGEISPCIHQNHVFAVRPFGVESEWLNWANSTEYARQFFFSRAKQSTNLASISSSNLRELPIPCPPEEERRAIVTYLDSETARIDQLIAKASHVIELLREHRLALISAAVTGKIDIEQGHK